MLKGPVSRGQIRHRDRNCSKYLTLSTCSGAGYETRWVVQAPLKMEQALCAGES